MTKFRTEFPTVFSETNISYTDPILTLGSCFADNIGMRLQRLKYNICVNPFGSLYNPLSIRNSLALLLNDYEFTEDDLFYHDDLWHSFLHHGKFSSPDKEKVLENITATLEKGREQLFKARFLMITLGTTWTYTLKETNQVVSNNHKLPDFHFNRRRLEPEEIVEQMTTVFKYLRRINPDLEIILTVSPIRHLKDGMSENALSKASLILAANRICQKLPFVKYFSAYEIMMDDLRDYRFYKEDMTHPTEQAIDYIFEKFEATFLDEKDRTLRNRIHKLMTGVEHRPLHEDTAQFEIFLERQANIMKDLEREYGFLDFSEERKRLMLPIF